MDLQGTRILLLQNDDVYAAVDTDAYGVFEFPELPAGEYSCVAVGQDGIGCIGIYLGESAADSDDGIEFEEDGDDEDMDSYAPISFSMMPSETTGWLHDLAIETAYQRVISRPRYDYEEPQHGGFRRPRGYKEVGAYPIWPDHPLADSTLDTSRWYFMDGDRDDEFAR